MEDRTRDCLAEVILPTVDPLVTNGPAYETFWKIASLFRIRRQLWGKFQVTIFPKIESGHLRNTLWNVR